MSQSDRDAFVDRERGTPDPVAILKSYLKSEKESVRAVAASVLFAGTDKAKEYVPIDRIIFGNIINDSETGGLDRA